MVTIGLCLCLENGLQLRLRGNHKPVPLHLGPTGALRIPLQQFTGLQLTALQRAQSTDIGKPLPEFEVLKLNERVKPPELDKISRHRPHSTSPLAMQNSGQKRSRHALSEEANSRGEDCESMDTIDPTLAGRAHAPPVPVRAPAGDHHWSTVTTAGPSSPDRTM